VLFILIVIVMVIAARPFLVTRRWQNAPTLEARTLCAPSRRLNTLVVSPIGEP